MTSKQIHDYLDAGVITQLQADILQYRRRGFSQRVIALGLGKARATIRDHEEAAYRNIANHHRQESAA